MGVWDFKSKTNVVNIYIVSKQNKKWRSGESQRKTVNSGVECLGRETPWELQGGEMETWPFPPYQYTSSGWRVLRHFLSKHTRSVSN